MLTSEYLCPNKSTDQREQREQCRDVSPLDAPDALSDTVLACVCSAPLPDQGGPSTARPEPGREYERRKCMMGSPALIGEDSQVLTNNDQITLLTSPS